jgi:hypothetical protein
MKIRFQARKLLHQSVKFSAENALKLAYDHLLFQKKFLGSLALAIRERREREERGRDGRSRGAEGR